MRRHQIPYLPHAMRTDHHAVGIARQTDHPVVGIKWQLRPNNRPPHHPAKIGTEESGVICKTSDRLWIVEQDTQDRSTDREDVPRSTTMDTYSDVTNLTTLRTNAVDGLHQSYVAMWPDIEAPRTLFASLIE